MGPKPLEAGREASPACKGEVIEVLCWATGWHIHDHVEWPEELQRMLSVAHLATWCAAPFAALLITAMPHGALSEEIAGGASVINADTIEIRGERIRLEGIDAPESSQLCEDETGDRYRCGQLAALALDDFLIDKTVRCEVVGRDRYQRALGDCFAGDVGLSDMLVRAGLAIAYRRYSKEFIGAEDEAKAERRGIWAGRFVEPWKWRKGERL